MEKANASINGVGFGSPWGLMGKSTPLVGFSPKIGLRCLYRVQSWAAQPSVWGQSSFFLPALSCPANSSYSLCTNLCSNSCAGLVDASRCPQKCTEGCRCDEGYTFDGNACVPKDKCGCFVEGIYYKVVMPRGWGIWGFLNQFYLGFILPACMAA